MTESMVHEGGTEMKYPPQQWGIRSFKPSLIRCRRMRGTNTPRASPMRGWAPERPQGTKAVQPREVMVEPADADSWQCGDLSHCSRVPCHRTLFPGLRMRSLGQ